MDRGHLCWALAIASLSFVGCDGSGIADGGVDASAVDGGDLDASSTVGDAGEDAATSDAGAEEDSGAGPDGGSDAGPPPPSLDERVARLSDPSADAASLDALLDDVAWNEGWPLRDGTRWLFATRWDEAPGAASLVSDVNDWSPAPANRAASGVHYWVVLDEGSFVAPAGGAVYKWFATPDVYRAPPEARAYGFDTFGEYGYVAPPSDVRWRERFEGFVSAHLEAPRAFRTYLPVGFTRGDRARVLVMHDGQNVFHPNAFFGGWRVDEAIGAAGFEDVVVLAIDNAPDRFDAYTHVVDDYGGPRPAGGRADDYGRLVFEEALPFLRSHYGLRASPADVAVAGSSLGGLVSLYLALTHGEDLRCAIAMSSTLGWGAFDRSADGSDALVSRWSSRGPAAIYLDSGGAGTCSDPDGDGVHEDSDDSDNYCTTLQMRDRLTDLGYRIDEDLFHWHDRGASHNEAAWAARVPRALAACVTAGWTP